MLRQEFKYFLNNHDPDVLIPFLKRFMITDPAMTSSFGYEVSSLYFDDSELRCISQKQNGSFNKQKFRIRFYNQNQHQVYFEVKSKSGDLSDKSRGTEILHDSNIFKDIHNLTYFLNNLKATDPAVLQFLYYYHRLQLKPLLWVHFKRQAYVCPFGSGLRLTIDRNLSGNFFLSKSVLNSHDNISFGEQSPLLEVKIKKAIPNWLDLLLSELQAQKISFSKYFECFCSLQDSPFTKQNYIDHTGGY